MAKSNITTSLCCVLLRLRATALRGAANYADRHDMASVDAVHMLTVTMTMLTALTMLTDANDECDDRDVCNVKSVKRLMRQ